MVLQTQKGPLKYIQAPHPSSVDCGGLGFEVMLTPGVLLLIWDRLALCLSPGPVHHGPGRFTELHRRHLCPPWNHSEKLSSGCFFFFFFYCGKVHIVFSSACSSSVMISHIWGHQSRKSRFHLLLWVQTTLHPLYLGCISHQYDFYMTDYDSRRHSMSPLPQRTWWINYSCCPVFRGLINWGFTAS